MERIDVTVQDFLQTRKNLLWLKKKNWKVKSLYAKTTSLFTWIQIGLP